MCESDLSLRAALRQTPIIPNRNVSPSAVLPSTRSPQIHVFTQKHTNSNGFNQINSLFAERVVVSTLPTTPRCVQRGSQSGQPSVERLVVEEPSLSRASAEPASPARVSIIVVSGRVGGRAGR